MSVTKIFIFLACTASPSSAPDSWYRGQHWATILNCHKFKGEQAWGQCHFLKQWRGLLFGPQTFLEIQKLEPSTQRFVWPWPEKVSFFLFYGWGQTSKRPSVKMLPTPRSLYLRTRAILQGFLACSTNLLTVNLSLPNWPEPTGSVNSSLMSFCHQQ